MRKLALVAVAAAAALGLSACGGGGSSAGKSNAEEVTEAPSGLPVQGETLQYDPNHLVNDGKPITLEWWTWGDTTNFQIFADAYSEIHPNVEINLVSQPWDDYWTKLPLTLKGGASGPTIFNVHNSQDANLRPYLAPYDVDRDALLADYTGAAAHEVDGNIEYVDYGMMTGLVYYNKAMWQEAGLTDNDIPATWDDFREVAKKLTISDGGSFTQAGFSFNDLYKEIGLGLPYQLGYNLMQPDMTTPDVNNAGMLENMQRFIDLYEVDQVGSKDFGLSASDSFGQGQVAMIINWGHFAGTLANDFPDIDYGTFPTPTPDANDVPYAYDRYNGESTMGLNKGASAEQLAVGQDFNLFFLTYTEGIKGLCMQFSLYPSYVPLQDDAELLANPVVSALKNADRYIWPGALPATFEDNIDKAYQDVIFNGVDPQAALDSANQAITSDLERTPFRAAEDLYEFYEPSPGQN